MYLTYMCMYFHFLGSSVTIEYLVEIILHIMEDESSVAVRLALLGIKKCLIPLLMGTHSPTGLEAVLKLLSIQNNPYWLVKVSNGSITVFLCLIRKWNIQVHVYFKIQYFMDPSCTCYHMWKGHIITLCMTLTFLTL